MPMQRLNGLAPYRRLAGPFRYGCFVIWMKALLVFGR